MHSRSGRPGRPRLARRPWLGVLAPLAAVVILAVGCGGNEDDADDSLADDLEQTAESAGARVVAEALRALLLVDDLDDDQTRRDIEVINETIDDLPGHPDVIGIEDEDGDGQDDDGNIEVRVDQEIACMSIDTGGGVDVSGGEC